MKIRIKGNSLRLRLDQVDLDQLVSKGNVEEKTEFRNSTFSYEIVKDQSNSITCFFADGKIRVNMPNDWVEEWVHSEKVGFEQTDGNIKVLIEKDFQCLTERKEEDESNMFPNPMDKHSH